MLLIPIRKVYIIGLMIFALYLTVFANPAGAVENEIKQRKVIIFIVDNVNLSDFQNPRLHNLNVLINSGGIGLMNTRTKSLTSTNRASAYLTIGMGTRVQISGDAGGHINGPEEGRLHRIIYPEKDKIRALIKEEFPNYIFGKFGTVAKQNGLKISLVGNSDTDRPLREAALIATDNDGIIDMGNIGPDILVRDPDFVWGHRTDNDKLLKFSLEALEHSEILFIDYGDTTRVAQAEQRKGLKGAELEKMKSQALGSADAFMGALLEHTKEYKPVIIVISPTHTQRDKYLANKSLAPVIIYESGKKPGLLTSKTTRRSGLIANIDIGPAILQRTGIDPAGLSFIGQNISTIPEYKNYDTVKNQLDQYVQVKYSRYAVHGLYVILLATALACLYSPLLTARKILDKRLSRGIALMALAIPAVSFVVSSVLDLVYYLEFFIILIISALVGRIYSRKVKSCISGMFWMSLITSVFILFDLLSGTGLLLKTPLGFNDVFSGGRYYGINNDSMGILLGSTVFWLFYLFERTGIHPMLRIIIAVSIAAVAVISMTPSFGANVGGTIAAMTTGVVAVIALVSGIPLKRSKVVVTVIVVFMVELVIAYIDSRYGQLSHAGRVMSALINGSFKDKFIEILVSKLSLFGLMLMIPPWNIMLGFQIYLYYLIKKRLGDIYIQIYKKFPLIFSSFEVILYGGLVAFVFNDTGVIATALMLTYLTLPLGVFLNTEKL